MLEGYFDYAAATPPDEGITSVLNSRASELFYNPSALYGPARLTKKSIESARQSIAACIGVKANEIVFTSSCSEANNLAIQGIMTRYPGKKLLICGTEHDSVYETALKFNHDIIPVHSTGKVDLEKLKKLIDEDTVLVSVALVNNEVGTVQELRKIRNVLNEVSKARSSNLPLLLHTDAAQAANCFKIMPKSLGADMMSISSAKIYGPKGAACLYTSKDVKLLPLIHGGGQEMGLRSSTENSLALIGFSLALEAAQQRAVQEYQRLAELSSILRQGLLGLGFTLHSGETSCSPHIVSASFKGADNEELVMKMDEAGYLIATGSACHATSKKKSRTLGAMGFDDATALSTLRFSLGKYTTEEGINSLLAALSRFIAK